jgi:predicted nucleic acid-binding protein
MTDAPVLVDTNVFVYAFDADEPEKRKISRELLARCFRSEARYAVSVQNLAEFSVVVTEKMPNPLPADIAARFVEDIAAFTGWQTVAYSGATVAEAIRLAGMYRVHFWDALLAATMLEHGIGRIVTEDHAIGRIPGITVEDPYRTLRGSPAAGQ